MVHRRLGLRFVMVLGTLLLSVALVGSSFASKIWHLFLSQGVFFGWGMGFLYLPALSALPAWFSSKRSLACGLAASGAGMGGLLYNLAAGYAVQKIGVAWSYRVFALVGLAVNLVCALVMKEWGGSSEHNHRYIRIHEFKHLGLILIALWGIVTEFGYITLLYSLPAYAASIELDTQQGSMASAMLNLGLVVGRPLVGHFSDQYGRINVSMAMTGLCGVLCFALWMPATSYGLLLAFATLVGMICGTFWSAVSAVTAEVVGVQRVSPAFSLICIALVAPTTFAEPAALTLSTWSGYQGTQIFVACMFLAGSLCLWLLRSWQLFVIERKGRLARDEESSSHRELLSIVAYMDWISVRKLFLSGRV
ncbi:hypothetical protein ASPZODRAFT_133743 [Penicilliopsis zonata CBS 506.65]|uniref:Major facilitator superfamily (MFS) profile domain-containing protein n=1 Tax=Penicilliopsis zonata CBS 506.65 TaxID=1073090 RepID=A0A1L9SF95_9EURO|nr:hypothetical protein ASPZODRAFT_133743 [Penicilliopsis zonata CBS 506.65]OJJ45871.1 hypothetical protein ASPZODRAFT_133743 [Penicilliopsis zonata CBS 506.65]